MPVPYDTPTPIGRDSTPADTTTVKTLTPLVGSTGCVISCETTDARVTFDGTTPSATNGLVLKAGQQPLYLPFAEVTKWISTAAAVSTLDIQWLRN